jgi:amino acid transporter
MWGLTIALSALSYGAAGFLLQAFDVEEPSKTATVLTALGILAFGSFANIIGRGTLKVLVIASLICEGLASVVLGTVLLIFYRENPVSVLFEGIGSEPLLGAPLLAATAYVGWSFVGFEAAGSIAEEVEKPERDVPKALIVALASVGAIVMYSAAGLILAIPDLDAAGDGDPVTGTLVHHFGSGIGRPLLILFVIGFVASFLAVQAAVSRVIWASARDKALPGSAVLGRLALAERMPVNAILLTAAGAAVFVLLSGSTLYAVLVNFTTIGFYVAFGLPVWGSALQHLRGTWRPGVFNLGRWSAPVTYVAAVWLAVQTLNIVWPRDTAEPWYVDWSMVMTFSVVAVAGATLYLTYARRRIMPRYGDRLSPPSSGT